MSLLSSLWFFIFIVTVTNFIMKAFINGRTVFGTPVTAFPPEYPRQMVGICHFNLLVFTWRYCQNMNVI